MAVGYVADGEDEGREERSTCEGDEDEVFIEFLLLVYTPTDHQSASEEGRSMVLYVQSSSRSSPFVTLEVED